MEKVVGGVLGWVGVEEGGARVPSLRDDDIVEGLSFVAEAGEPDFDDHTWV